MEIKNEIKNDAMKRKEIVFTVESDKTPSFDEARKMIAEKLKVDESVIDVFRVIGTFGRKNFDLEANIYYSKEDLVKTVALRKTKKKKVEEKKAKIEERKAAKEARDNPPAEEVAAEAAPVEETPSE